MTPNEQQRLAAAIAILRPDWHTESLRTFLTRGLISIRPYQDAATALAYVATDPQSKTPARVNEPGPWWHIGNTDPEPTRTRGRCKCGDMHTHGSPCRTAPPAADPAGHAKTIRGLMQKTTHYDKPSVETTT